MDIPLRSPGMQNVIPEIISGALAAVISTAIIAACRQLYRWLAVTYVTRRSQEGQVALRPRRASRGTVAVAIRRLFVFVTILFVAFMLVALAIFGQALLQLP
jgi:hypothetical protein